MADYKTRVGDAGLSEKGTTFFSKLAPVKAATAINLFSKVGSALSFVKSNFALSQHRKFTESRFPNSSNYAKGGT